MVVIYRVLFVNEECHSLIHTNEVAALYLFSNNTRGRSILVLVIVSTHQSLFGTSGTRLTFVASHLR